MTDTPRPPGFVWVFPATVDRVIDGDTVECHVLFTAEDERHGVSVRVEGINALERSDRYGSEATAYAQALLPESSAVMLVHRKREKYGRFLARIVLADGRDFGELMLTAKASDGETPLALPYAA